MEVIRTPAARFSALPGFGHKSRSVDVGDDESGPLRMAYVDVGPADRAPVLLVHGQPTWSFLYRQVIDVVVAAGHRVIAPDLIGFGRSDKPTRPTDYTTRRHVAWLGRLVTALDLTDVTVVVQDWGGPIGLAVLTEHPDRFAAVVATNTMLHTADPALDGRLTWALHDTGDGRVVIEASLLDYVAMVARTPDLDASLFVAGATQRPVPPDVAAAYDAPFPDERYRAGLRQFPALIPLTGADPTARLNRRTWAALASWSRPLLTAYSDGDPASRGWDRVFQERVPGAAGQAHCTIADAGHFVPEDAGATLGRIVADFVAGR